MLSLTVSPRGDQPLADQIVAGIKRQIEDRHPKLWKTRERKPEMEVVEMAVPPIIDAAEFEAVQTLLKSRSPALTAPRIVSGPTLLTGICFCTACGKAMTLRTGKGGRCRYYTCSTK